VRTPGSFGHMDIVWEDPAAALFLRTLASFSRVIRFDRRGTGASDPVPLEHLPPWESYAEDLAAVLNQVDVERTAVMAGYDAGPMAMFFAATRPQRISALILANTRARWVAADNYPIGIPRQVAEALIAGVEQA
jgi:pimeloyl-ACP methyl ester carboxylesterase